ncbi:C4-dicarboxylic acid transporter DauA [Haliea sp. E1-2-M8]|uniref:C4-dicarboxylic acid transporter DauA n=1 Tax=Haliea sp. E1-2-M8 TaxID=3064706 RepID=UPI00271A9B73|nr:C4-dicarboxylic acid transporter DauA [Haliea sp. E1-2-M8]MDO8863541.1 C4-dicarboxylic acid transporter DauA [Haliea sp. E1-2-M8]
MVDRSLRARLPALGAGLRAGIAGGYGLAGLRADVMAGLTIGTVAIPLSMALAIAIGVAPQHGLYTAIVAGALIALTGGSRFNVSGPTAAFVVILIPIVQQFGLGGLLLATMMAGAILVVFGVSGLGRLVMYIPYPVVLGFTAGIAVVIAVLQLPDFLGLVIAQPGEHFPEKVIGIVRALPGINPAELGVGAFTLAILLAWPRLRLPVPAPLVALALAAAASWGLERLLGASLFSVETIASRFSWSIGGQSGSGIPPVLPQLALPWRLPGADGQPLVVDFNLFRALLGPAVAIAILGAIESLLCAVVADGLTRTRHDSNAELVGQGIGNLVAPLFGGITATAALARTATSIRSGARSPVAALVHSLVVLAALTFLAGLLGLVPMSALAALLLVVAWNMSESRHFSHTLRSAPPGDVAVLVVCFLLTVLFDMVIAVAVGIGLAAALLIGRMAGLSHTRQVQKRDEPLLQDLPDSVAVYDMNGPLFFAAAERALAALRVVDPEVKIVIIDMGDVSTMDFTAIVALQSLITDMNSQGIALIMAGLPARIILKLKRAGIRQHRGQLAWASSLAQASARARRWTR